jgi:sulfide:quinone oxidoreductase
VPGWRSPFVDEPVREPGEPTLEVVIAGAGVAALETALSVHELAGDRVKLTLLAPAAEFVYRPVAVLEPFLRIPPRRLALKKVADELNATLEQDTVAAVDCNRRVLRTGADRQLRYDALVIAVGARITEAPPGLVALDVSHMDESLRGVIEEIDAGSIRRLALVAPRATWRLPAYELALLVKRHARERKVDLDITIITGESRPLDVFGAAVSAAVAGALAEAGIETMVEASVQSSSGRLIVNPGARELDFDCAVVLPALAGPDIAGLPADTDGFLPVGPDSRVSGVPRVYAAGDATDFPIKFGGIAAQQADAAAASIAALAGVPTEPRPGDGRVHGVLLSGRERGSLYFSARIEGGVAVESRVDERPGRHSEAKITARYLGAYLDELWADGLPWRLVARAG